MSGGLWFFLWIVGKFIVQERVVFRRAGKLFQAAPQASRAIVLEVRSDHLNIKWRFGFRMHLST